MPLHLLGKKSWNPYNPAAIAKVRADEAEAAAKEAADDQRQQEYDAERRLALLRGLPHPSAPPAPSPAEESSRPGKRARSEKDGQSDSRKRRRRTGEDDTDRDLRFAKEDAQFREQQLHGKTSASSSTRGYDAPLTDHAGHIQLFAAPSARDIRAEKNAEAEAERKKKERALEDQYTLRFSNAAGFKIGVKDKPWYANQKEIVRYTGTEELESKALALVSDGKDAFGNEDDGRVKRDAKRIVAADPMAMMKKAQVRLKEVEKEREASNRVRERELWELKEMQEREERRAARKRIKREVDDLEDFSLDAIEDQHGGSSRTNDEHREHHQRHHSRSHEAHSSHIDKDGFRLHRHRSERHRDSGRHGLDDRHVRHRLHRHDIQSRDQTYQQAITSS